MALESRSQYLINHLQLQPHIEGGYYRRFYQNSKEITIGNKVRPLSTSILYLLEGEATSHFHRLQSDELWFFHEGCDIILHQFDEHYLYKTSKLGTATSETHPQLLISGGVIFGAELSDKSSYALVSCMVSPGFDFNDYELLSTETLVNKNNKYRDLILRINRMDRK